jgi:hypothetical protein
MTGRTFVLCIATLLPTLAACDGAGPGTPARGAWQPFAKADDASTTCVGRCGDEAPAGCWCDSQCHGYGDCCPDVHAVCEAPPPASLAFAPAVEHAAGRAPMAIAIADVNGDGKPDLVTANNQGWDVSVILATGGGAFAAPQSRPGGTSPRAVAVADLDGDGVADIVVADASAITVDRATGSTTYATGSLPASLAIGDLDGDGHPDIVVAFDLGFLAVLRNKGDGTFEAPAVHAIIGDHVALADVDGDGALDVVVSGSGVRVVHNDGQGKLAAPVEYAAGADASSITIADVDGDGFPDLVVTDYGNDRNLPGGVDVLLGRGDGTFADALVYPAGKGAVAVAAVDLDGDGALDLAVACRSSGDLNILRNTGAGAFAAPIALGALYAPLGVAAGDLDGDGVPDIVLANAYGVALVMNHTGQ